jgi:hypothetical protein
MRGYIPRVYTNPSVTFRIATNVTKNRLFWGVSRGTAMRNNKNLVLALNTQKSHRTGCSCAPSSVNTSPYSILEHLLSPYSNSPSQRAMITVARQFPITFTDVRAMSIN